MGRAESYPDQRSPYAEMAAIAMMVVTLVALFVCAGMWGGMLRHEMSPWAWVQFRIDSARHGSSDASLTMLFYLGFYVSLVFLPYSLLRFLFWLAFLNNEPANEAALDPVAVRTATGALALASGVLLFTFLNNELAFARAVPSETWNGWLLIGALGSALFLVIGSMGMLRREIQKLRVVLSHDAYVICRCSKCDHMWAAPAKSLGNRWIRDEFATIKQSAGGYPIE